MINLSDYLTVIPDDFEFDSKGRLFEQITQSAFPELSGDQKSKIKEKLTERERKGSTGIGKGIALPHASLQFLEQTRVLLTSFPEGIDFDAVDDKPVYLVFMILGPPENRNILLQLLAKISRLCKHEELREKILSCVGREDTVECLTRFEKEHS